MLANFSKNSLLSSVDNFTANPLVDAHLHITECLINEEYQPSSINYSAITCLHSKKEWETFLTHPSYKNPRIKKTFGLHPQGCVKNSNDFNEYQDLDFLEKLLKEKKIHGIGEAGFDLFTEEFKSTLSAQKIAFEKQLDLALFYQLPMVIHLRKAFDTIFLYSDQLKKIPAVIFHGFSGGSHEAFSILRKGINAYFSFGKVLLRGSRKACDCLFSLEPNRLLLETDAPYMTLKGEKFTSYKDIRKVYDFAYSLLSQKKSGLSFEDFCQGFSENFKKIF